MPPIHHAADDKRILRIDDNERQAVYCPSKNLREFCIPAGMVQTFSLFETRNERVGKSINCSLVQITL
jgi:hypothetical protein